MKKILIALMMTTLSTGVMAEDVSNAELLEEIKQLKKEVAGLNDVGYYSSSTSVEDPDPYHTYKLMEILNAPMRKFEADNMTRQHCRNQFWYDWKKEAECYRKNGVSKYIK